MTPNRGFTLLEMAVVLMIVGLLLGGLIPTLSAQMEQQRRNETRKQLDEIRDALIGYAIINKRLPCPRNTTTDPSGADYGEASATCNTDRTAEGYLPWKTLGVSEIDAWGIKRSNTSDPWIGYWRYRVDRNFASTISLSTGFGICPPSPTPHSDCLAIQDSSGNSLTSATERPIAIVFSTGPNLKGNEQNANVDESSPSFEPTDGFYQSNVPTPTFDDMLIWISRPQLFNRMVAAGQLP